MFLVSTRNFPPDIGGIQNLMEGLSNALLNHGPVKVFADDFEFALKKMASGIKLNPDNNADLVDSLTKKYFQKNLVFKSNERDLPFDYLGKIYRNDLLVAYLEILLDSTVINFDVKNTLLFDFTDDQKNILHFRSQGRRRSFLSVSSKHTFDIELNLSK